MVGMDWDRDGFADSVIVMLDGKSWDDPFEQARSWDDSGATNPGI